MRANYNWVKYDGFPAHRVNTAVQRPTKVVWHRQGNPGVEGENGLAYGARTGAFSIHFYVDDATVFEAIPWDRHAFHVLESRKASLYGLPTSGVYGQRGDYNTIGIELEDEDPASTPLAPGQAYGLSQETRITAVLLGADIVRWFPWLTPADFIEHADLDPWTRAEDIGDGLYMPDFRLDVEDVLAGRTPWRTVGQFARGSKNPGPAPKPTPLYPPPPAVETFTQADVDAAFHAGRKEMFLAVKAVVDAKGAEWGV